MAPLRPSGSGASCSRLLQRSSSAAHHPAQTTPILSLLSRPISSASSFQPSSHHVGNRQQVRHATFLRRPKRPYQFTQLVTLSDGSSYLHRTSSPAPIHKSLKDQRNAALWNPTSSHLHTVEADAAGRLRAFRARFGRGWDMEDGATSPTVKQEARDMEQEGARELSGEAESEEGEGEEGQQMAAPTPAEAAPAGKGADNLLDLISGFKMNEDIARGLKSKKERPTPATSGGGKKKK